MDFLQGASDDRLEGCDCRYSPHIKLLELVEDGCHGSKTIGERRIVDAQPLKVGKPGEGV